MSEALTLTRPKSFYENIVIRFHEKMNKGRLNLTLPDGQTLALGGDDNEIVANITINHEDFYKKMLHCCSRKNYCKQPLLCRVCNWHLQ